LRGRRYPSPTKSDGFASRLLRSKLIWTRLAAHLVNGLDRNNRVQLKGITIQLFAYKIEVRKLDGAFMAAFVASDPASSYERSVGTFWKTASIF